MSFFDSDIVQEEIKNISNLSDLISNSVLVFHTLPIPEMVKRVDVLQEMLDKLNLFYLRLSLSDDVEAQQMKEKLQKTAVLMGASDAGNINEAFDGVQHLINNMRDELDRQQRLT
jgi:hypothetical protein